MLLKFAIKDFLDDREFKNLSKVTLAGYKLTITEFHGKRKNPARKVQPFKADVKTEVFTDSQIRQMLGYFQRIKAREKTFYAYRDYTIIIVLLGTGLRLGELVNLRWDDVDLHNQTLTVFGKKRQQSSVPMTPKLKKELCEYRVFAERQLGELPEYVFTTTRASA